ncbi:GNAT family N-acetyltransferase [Paenibacillus paridis]|uniref:GNAT family N-acetyltransferase n=1 Tax=Paenibacillus paridis TaxID=2583376 RepID=UPI00111E1E11|nr:GNAT family protein [Paenibacillus paridis]
MKGETIYLKLLEVEDADKLLALRQQNRHFLQPFEPLRQESYFTVEEQARMIASGRLAAQNDQAYAFGVFTVATDVLIGRIELSGVARGPFQNAFLGYFLDQACNGRGMMTEAVSLCLAYAFEQLGLHRIQAAVMPRNLPSIRVLEKAGFRQEGLARHYLHINGLWEDHALFAMTVEDRQGMTKSKIAID